MKRAKIAELRDNLSRYLEHVRAGGTVVVLDRDTPVAQIVPLTTADVVPDDDRARLDRLARRGLVRRGRGGSMGWLLKHEPLKIRGSVLKDLFEERESGW